MTHVNCRRRHRSHIHHLKNMIDILQKENSNSATCELMETISLLRSENDGLRRIIGVASAAVDMAADGTTPPRTYSTTHKFPRPKMQLTYP
jgi:hypothetical protein